MDNELDRLATDMFRTFARFEYALKATGFHKGDGAAEPNWRAFAETVSGLFDDPCNEALLEAVDYMLAHPPKKQVIADGLLAWSNAPPQTNLRDPT